MESKFQTSFIPKKPLERSPGERHVRRPMGLFGMIAFVIFFLSLAGWGGVIVWQSYENSVIEKDQQSLQASQKEFELGTVETLTRLNSRLTAGETLLSDHVGMSKLFQELEEMTLKNIRFNDFSLIYSGTADGVKLAMKGQATNYAVIAKQSDFFNQNRHFSSTIFSNLDLDQTGKVVFSVSTILDPKAFVYGDSVPEDNASTTSPTAPSDNSPFNSPN